MSSNEILCNSTRPPSIAIEDCEANSMADVLRDCREQRHQLLYLNYRGLTEFPVQLLKNNVFEHVQGIYLKRNLLQTLPENLKTLLNLKELYLPSNLITDLPEDMSELIHLESLDLSMNSLKHIPHCIYGMKSLKTLILSQNSIVNISPEICKLTGLVTFVINHNMLKSLPSEIHNCSSLQTLNLDKNYLRHLPRQITLLSRLEELSVTGNQLLYLPMDLGYCPSLKRVYADNNKWLKAVPFTLWSKIVGTYGCGIESVSDLEEFKQSNMSAYIPDEIRSVGSKLRPQVTPLLEFSFRVVNKYKGIMQISSLPRSVSELAMTATAHCEFHGCNRALFTAAYPHLLKHPIATRRQQNSATFIGLCCSIKCLDLFSKFPIPL